jgi:hypothetical protein
VCAVFGIFFPCADGIRRYGATAAGLSLQVKARFTRGAIAIVSGFGVELYAVAISSLLESQDQDFNCQLRPVSRFLKVIGFAVQIGGLRVRQRLNANPL